jgi:hypothetical protein
MVLVVVRAVKPIAAPRQPRSVHAFASFVFFCERIRASSLPAFLMCLLGAFSVSAIQFFRGQLRYLCSLLFELVSIRVHSWLKEDSNRVTVL